MSLSISPAISPLFCQSIAGVLTVNLRAADLDPGLETLGLREVSMVCSSFDAKHLHRYTSGAQAHAENAAGLAQP